MERNSDLKQKYKVVILAGGKGTRITEESRFLPKPMIEIGSIPILIHIMKIYSHFGYNEFIICTGYKSHKIKEYFELFHLRNSNITFDFSNGSKIYDQTKNIPWKVTIVDTGLKANTGTRLKLIQDYVKDDPCFFFTYGDGLADVNIDHLVNSHLESGKTVTITAVNQPSRYGILELNQENNLVKSFKEKPTSDNERINGGFFVLSQNVFNYLDGFQNPSFENQPLVNLVRNNEVSAFKHDGFWHSMDTMRDKVFLEGLWEDGNAPWLLSS